MPRLGVVVAIWLPAVSACSGAIGMRFGAGADVIPHRYMDLDSYDTGNGADFRVDLGFTATNREEYSLRIFSANYGGITAMIGVEIPVSKLFIIDPAVRWDHFARTDYFYLGVGPNVHLVWKPY